MMSKSKKIVIKKVTKETTEEILRETEKTRGIEEKGLKKESAKEMLDMLSKCVVPATFIIAIMTTLVSVLRYTFQLGELSYWRVSTAYIAMREENPLFGIVIYILLTIVFAVANVVICGILVSQEKGIGEKFLKCAGMVLFIDIIISAFLLVDAFWELTVDVGVAEIIKKPGFIGLIRETFLTILPAAIICYFPGIAVWIEIRCADMKKKKAKQKEGKVAGNVQTDNIKTESGKVKEWLSKQSNALAIIITVVFSYAILALAVYCDGYYIAHCNTNFRVINDTQVVLYEGENIFIVSDCELITDEDGKSTLYVDKKSQTEINKSGVTTTEIRVEKAYRNKRR